MPNGQNGLEVYKFNVDAFDMSLIGAKLSAINWVFMHIKNNGVMRHFQIIFELLEYWGLWLNGNILNAFTFESQVEVRKYVVKLKELLLWQLTMLEKSRNLDLKIARCAR